MIYILNPNNECYNSNVDGNVLEIYKFINLIIFDILNIYEIKKFLNCLNNMNKSND